LSSGHAKRIGHLPNSPQADKHRRRRRTNKKLEQWIIIILGIEEMRNTYANSRGTITPLQISKQVPDSILHSFDDIQNTMHDMKKKGLLHELEELLRLIYIGVENTKIF
jgi:hypothetical protein